MSWIELFHPWSKIIGELPVLSPYLSWICFLLGDVLRILSWGWPPFNQNIDPFVDLFEHGGCASVRPKGKEQAENWHLTNLDACTPHGKVEKNIEPNQPIWGFPAVRWKTGFQPFMSMLGHAPKKGTSSPQAPMFELLALGGNILWLNSALQKELSEFSLKLNHPRLSNQLVNTYHIYSIYIL